MKWFEGVPDMLKKKYIAMRETDRAIIIPNKQITR